MPTVPAIYLPMSYKGPRWMQGQIVTLSIVAHGATRGHLLFGHSGGILLQAGKVADTMVALGVLFGVVEVAL